MILIFMHLLNDLEWKMERQCCFGKVKSQYTAIFLNLDSNLVVLGMNSNEDE